MYTNNQTLHNMTDFLPSSANTLFAAITDAAHKKRSITFSHVTDDVKRMLLSDLKDN